MVEKEYIFGQGSWRWGAFRNSKYFQSVLYLKKTWVSVTHFLMWRSDFEKCSSHVERILLDFLD